MTYNMSMDFTESIAVLGPEEAGKTSLLSQMGERISTQWSYRVTEPVRYKINPDVCPELAKTVFSVYESPSQLMLDFPERRGLIVLNLNQLRTFSKADALQQYSDFFEFLRKLTWLGVDQFVLAITYMDILPVSEYPWFFRTSKRVVEGLETIFEFNIKGLAPLTMDGSGSYDNLFKAKPKDILPWNEGPTLIDALRDMILSNNVMSKKGFWASGKIENQGEDGKNQWSITHKARGNIIEGQQVRVYPEDLKGKLATNGKVIEFEYESEKLDKISNARQDEVSVLISANSGAHEHTLLRVHTILKSGVSPLEPQIANRVFSFTFFGSQNKEGEINKSTPAGSDIHSPTLSDQKSLMSFDREDLKQTLGHEAYLRIYCRGSGAVTDLYNKDPDAGRVLIWDVDVKKRVLIGVGRITDFPNIQIQDFTEKLMLFDQFRVMENPASKLLIFTLEKIYHNSKRFMEISSNQLNPTFIKETQKRIVKSFDTILRETTGIQDKIIKEYLPRDLVNLHPHLSDAKDTLLEQYEELLQLISSDKSEKVIQQRLDYLKEEYTRNDGYVRNQAFEPFLNCAEEAVNSLPKEMRTKVKIHNRMLRDCSYYPREPSALETILETLDRLLDNSRSYASKEDDIRVDIFIDPPDFKNPDHVRILYQDNGIVDKTTLHRIKKSERGIKVLKKKMSYEEVELQEPVQMGCGTRFIIKISTWKHRLGNIESAAADLVDILSSIDYKLLKIGQTNDNFLIRLDSILDNEDRSALQQELKNLLSEAKEVSESDEHWFQRSHSYFYSPTSSDSFTEIREIRRTIHHLSNLPVFHAVYEAVALARTAFPKYSIRVPNSPESLPLHKIKSASFYQTLMDTFSWGLTDLIMPHMIKDSQNKLAFSFRMSPPGQDGEQIAVFLTGLPADLSGILVPLKSRFAYLGVKMAFPGEMKNTVVFHIPVQKS